MSAPSLTAFTSIPLIDIAPLFGADEAAKEKVAQEIDRAASEVGFLYVTGHPIPASLITRLEKRAAEFFALPQAEKDSCYIGKSRAHRGYVPVAEEGFYDGSDPTKIDKKEAFDLSIELPEDDPDHLRGYRMLGPNQWPENLPAFRQDIYAYYEAVSELGRTLFSGFARALGLAPDYFEAFLTKPPSQLRLVHYPEQDPHAAARADWGISAHTDYECFTILHATGPGLQVMNAAEEWIEAPPVEGAFVVNVGDMLEVLSNGRFIATSHRVRNVPEERFSFPLFCSLDYDAAIEPLPAFVKRDGGARYGRFIAGDHLVTQTMKTFNYLKKLHAAGRIAFPEPAADTASFGRARAEA